MVISMEQALQRLRLLIGDDIEKINKITVLIIGLGGVGGYTLEALARLGIAKFILVDGDKVETTNINRQIIATTKTIDMYKTNAWEKRILEINPSAQIKKISTFIDDQNIELLFQEPVDFIVDACDTISVKKEIIRRCHKQKIKLISSMGMGNKLDPSKIALVELSKTSYDPIAKSLRKMMKDERINGKVMTVCSTESPKKIKEKVIASNAIVPAVAGLYMADYVWKQILKGDTHES